MKKNLANLCSFCLLLTCSYTHADESKVTPEAVKWKTYAHIANMLMDANTKDDLMDTAENLKQEDPVEALVFYLIASKVDPKDPFPSYQAAAALSMMEEDKPSEHYLNEANNKGFWQYPTIVRDNELLFMKNNSAYIQLLKDSKSRYESKPDKHIGESLFTVPQGQIPADGWPVIVYLHGLGGNNESNKEMGPLFATSGYVYIALNGSEISGQNGSFQWHDPEWGEKNHPVNEKYITSAIDNVAKEVKINRDSIFISGFSEGAGEAGYLLATYPEHYAGALIISPYDCQKPAKTLASNKRIIIINGEKDGKGNIMSSEKFKKLFSQNNTVRMETHPGGHDFQKDYKTKFIDYMFWLNQVKLK